MAESIPSASPARPLFGVGRSALGRAWIERCDPASSAIALALAQTHGLPDLLARVLAGRGIGTAEAPAFLAPRLRDLMPDPDVLTGMAAAASRLADAVQRGESVAIFGDYDVDGAASAALLHDYLAAAGLRPRIHIPDRITEGYGPNAEAMRSFASEGASLVVTVDCGTAGHEPLAEAARLGLDVVVLDHHGAPEALPQAVAIVNPNRQDDLSGLGHLAAAGIVFMALVAISRELRRRGHWAARPEPDLLTALDLVALATVADVVPLVGLNRAFVRQGLAVMRARRRPGLTALADVAGLTAAPEAWHLGFLLGPRINAGGRIGDASLGARLLVETDAAAAVEIAARLDALNRERQAIETAAVADALARADQYLADEPDSGALVLSGTDWHPGILGLIAARVKERIGRPVFAFAPRPDGTLVGSGRSVPGADLGRAVREAVVGGAALRGGGHAMAAGASLAGEGLEAFRQALAAALPASSAEAGPEPLLVDAALSAGGATADLIAALDRAGPFGSGQPEPVFALGSHRLADLREVGTGHLRAVFRAADGATLRAVAFRATEGPLAAALRGRVGEAFHAAGTLCLDRWGGEARAELRLLDVAKAD